MTQHTNVKFQNQSLQASPGLVDLDMNGGRYGGEIRL